MANPLYKEYRELLVQANGGTDFPHSTLNEFKDSLQKDSDDILLIIDMQNDFCPGDAPGVVDGGRFGVAEGGAIIPSITKLIETFAATAPSGGQPYIYATRDYHPDDHCSFNTNGGPFPPHCLQGTVGSYLVEPIAAALTPLVQKGEAQVVFKAFSPDVDSFGGIEYDEEYAIEQKRVSVRNSTGENGSSAQAATTQYQGPPYCSVHCWTGSFLLKASAMNENINAPPDVMAVLSRKSLADILLVKKENGDSDGSNNQKKKRRLFVCGLAFDFCVLDTSLNAARLLQKQGVSDVEIVIIVNACRAAHIPGVGTFGSGFLSDPAEVVQKIKKHNVKMMEFNCPPLFEQKAVQSPVQSM